MAVNDAGTANHTVTPNFQTTRHDHTACNRSIVANNYVVSDLALVVYDNTIADQSVIQRTAIDSGAGTYFYAIADYHRA